MQDGLKGPERVRFADFEVDFRTGELRRRGVPIRIQAKPLAVLAAIVERPGELVSREELFKALWPVETFVDFDKNLSVAVTKLREILDDSALRPRFIETVPRRGYRFVGSLQPYPVVDINPAIQDQSPAQPSMTNDTLLVLEGGSPLVSNSDLAGVSAVGSDGLIAALALATVLLIATFAASYFPSGLRDRLLASRAPIPREVNPEAQQDFLKAKEFSERWIVDDVKSALIFDDRAIALEPDYAPAFSLRSTLLIRLGEMGVINSEQACNQARADAIRAVDLDPRLVSGYVSLAGIQMNHDWDLDGAEATLATARRMEPNDVSILSALSNLRRFRGQLDESISLQRQVITLVPLEGGSYGALAIRLFIAGRLDEALAAQQRALELDPQLEYLHLNRAEVLLAKGLPNEALREVEAEPGDVWRLIGKVLVMHDLGRTSESAAALQQLIATHPSEPYNIATVFAYCGDLDRAFVWLDRAYERRDVSLIQVQTDPLFRKLHPDPRFAALMRRMKA